MRVSSSSPHLWNKRHRRCPPRESREIQRIGEPKEDLPSFAALRDVEAGKCLPPVVKAETGAVRPLIEIEIGDARGDVAGIDEYGGIDMRHHCNTRLDIEQEQMAIVKSIVGVRSERIVAAEARLQVKRHDAPLVRVGGGEPSVRGDNDTRTGNGNEVRRLDVVAAEAERGGIA